MVFQEVLSSMRDTMQSALDELASTRSSPSSKTRALKQLEMQLAAASFRNEPDAKDAFQALQFTFECNIPSHLLPWLTLSTLRLEGLTSKSLSQDERAAEMDELISQLNTSLSLIQGVVLNHESSKLYLGRRPALEILLDLLLASRHVPCHPDSESKPSNVAPHITSTIIDTLLCILVDATTALRTFEEANGVQAVVKILKRAGTPREVRMKCLEFLYFYLLDETPSDAAEKISISALLQSTSTPSTAPTTPIRPSHKPYFSKTPNRPGSRYGSSNYSLSGSASLQSRLGPSRDSSSPRSVSGGSSRTYSSTSSNVSSSTVSTALSSVDGDLPIKESHSPVSPVKVPRTPPRVFSPPPATPAAASLLSTGRPKSPMKPTSQRLVTPPRQTLIAMTNALPKQSDSTGEKGEKVRSSIFQPLQPRSHFLLQREIDYVPLSPKKPLPASISRLVPSTPVKREEGTRFGTPLRSEREKRVLHRKSLSVSSASPALVPKTRGDESMWTRPLSPKRTTGSMLSKDLKDSSLESIIHQEIKDKSEREKEKEKSRKHDKENLNNSGSSSGSMRWKTTEEKKELLGTMLGNVDALVEGVRKAGIFGLG